MKFRQRERNPQEEHFDRYTDQKELMNPILEEKSERAKEFLDAIVRFSIPENDPRDLQEPRNPLRSWMRGSRIHKKEILNIAGMDIELSYQNAPALLNSYLKISTPEVLEEDQKEVIDEVRKVLRESARIQRIITLDKNIVGYYVNNLRNNGFRDRDVVRNRLRRVIAKEGIESNFRPGDIISTDEKEV